MTPDKPRHRDELIITGDRLTLQCTNKPPVSLRARDVVAIWYDYNPFGWMHANSLRLVCLLENGRTFIEVYDAQQTKRQLLAWLHQHFHSPVASRYQQLWGSPGGDYPSVQLWVADSPGA